MRFTSALALFIGLAAASPILDIEPREVPQSVRVTGVSLNGDGCPKGSAQVLVVDDGSLFEVSFSKYVVETGKDTKPADWSKNCKLGIAMEFDPGWQFSIMDTYMLGYAEIPKGAKGQCTNTFYFTGNLRNQARYDVQLPGYYSGDFQLHSDPGIVSWSVCNKHNAILNMNTRCSIAPTKLPALLRAEAVSGELKVLVSVNWRHC